MVNMSVMKSFLLGFVVVLATSACDIEMPNIANLPGGGYSSTALSSLRLPARKIPQNESVKLAKTASSRFGVDTAMVLGVITQESGFNAHAVSPVGAMGLMQIMPATFKHIKDVSPIKSGSAFDPKQNVAAGTWYLRSLYNAFTGFPEERRWQFALASYNGGIGRVGAAITKVSQAKRKSRTQVTWAEISPYLPRETRGYVPAVLAHRSYYR
ncbi:MAG: hypothetical protein CVV27_01135, partial [Candidatus Melainabacteria bacterium HGW-Melainabacteria-1]